MSEELAALLRRAERASRRAAELLQENELWRQRALQRLEHMYELGEEFRTSSRINYPPVASR